MSKREYPFIGGQRLHKPQRGQKRPLKTPPCAVCGAPSTHRVEIQINWFRGDDEAANACEAHRKDAAALYNAIAKAAAPVVQHLPADDTEGGAL